jgi:glucose-6-phosphate 1-epimerase
VPIIFQNRDRAIFDGKMAYRGGAPICFPYFSKGNLLPLGTTLDPQHGHARTSVWESKIGELENSVMLTTRQPTGAGYGPTEFSCGLVYTLGEDLKIEGTIANVGDTEAPFQIAVHAYWATAEPSKAIVKGLGNRYLDNLLNYSKQPEADSGEPHLAPFDRVYPDAAASLELVTETYEVGISTDGCSGAVLWNPGKDHTLKDLGSPDFICVESGVIEPGLNLRPGEYVSFEIIYEARLI